MTFPISLKNNQITLGSWKIGIRHARNKPSWAPFNDCTNKNLEVDEDDEFDLDSARSLAFRDAYAMIFMASGGEAISACGDKKVLKHLVFEGFLFLDEDERTIELAEKRLASRCFGLIHRKNEEKWYQATLLPAQ